jgi:hypothetical protein
MMIRTTIPFSHIKRYIVEILPSIVARRCTATTYFRTASQHLVADANVTNAPRFCSEAKMYALSNDDK